MNLIYGLQIQLTGEGWDSTKNRWRDKDKSDLRFKTKGTDPRSHFPKWVWDAVRDINVLIHTGTWPKEGARPKQSAPFVNLVLELTEFGFLKGC